MRRLPPFLTMLARTALPVSLARLAFAGLAVVSAPGPVLANTAASAPAVAGATETGWWALYRDPGLDSLIGRLHAANPGIAQAAARLASARADARITTAASLPTLGIDAAAAHAGGPLVNAAGQSGNLFTVRATASWELDLLGRLGDERRAGRQDAAAAAATLADVTLLMEAETARNWFAARSYALAADEADRAVRLLGERVAIGANRQQLGLAGPAALDALHQRLDAAQTRARDLALARDRARRQLGFLVGENAALPLGAGLALPAPPPVPADLPADILARRPDVRAAQARVAAADARLAAIRKGWLPPIALTATQGQASTSLGQLFASAGGVFGLAGLLALPVFDGGRHKAGVAGGRAIRDLREAEYRECVGLALRDVYDHLQAAQAGHATYAEVRAGEESAAVLAQQARLRAANGTLARAELLDTELVAIDRQIAVAVTHGETLANLITLQQSLGGGW